MAQGGQCWRARYVVRVTVWRGRMPFSAENSMKKHQAWVGRFLGLTGVTRFEPSSDPRYAKAALLSVELPNRIAKLRGSAACA